MKKMKRILIVLLLCVATVTFTACTSDTSSSNDLEEIKSRGKIVFGVKQDVPNFGYKDPETGELSGFEIDLAETIANDLDVEVELIPVTTQTRGALLDNDQTDAAIATFTITDERKETYNFSLPYFTDEVGFLVNRSNNFKSVQDLNGKMIGYAQASTTRVGLESLAEENNVQFDYSELSDYPTLKTALTSGRIDAFAVDKSILSGYVDSQTEILAIGFSQQEYGIATKKANTELSKKINELIEQYISDGTMNELLNKYNLTDASQVE